MPRVVCTTTTRADMDSSTSSSSSEATTNSSHDSYSTQDTLDRAAVRHSASKNLHTSRRSLHEYEYDNNMSPRKTHYPASPAKAAKPAYPKQHSFIVDMNNRPLYECEKKPRAVRQPSPAKPKPVVPQPSPKRSARKASMAHLPPSESPEVYYPPKSPFAKEMSVAQRRKKKYGCCGMSKRLSVCFTTVLVLLAIVFYFVLLGLLVETRDSVHSIQQKFDMLNATLEKIANPSV